MFGDPSLAGGLERDVLERQSPFLTEQGNFSFTIFEHSTLLTGNYLADSWKMFSCSEPTFSRLKI